MSLFNELKRRNVFRAAAAYIVVGWLVIQVTETVFPLFGFGDAPARITVIVVAIGFLPAMVLAWVFELTPEGLKKEHEVDRSASIASSTGKTLDRVIMVILALGLGYFAFDKFVLAPQRDDALQQQQTAALDSAAEEAREAGRVEALVGSYGDKSVAVMPFVNRSSDEEQEYFSDGISEELLNMLAKTPELRVISRSSSFSYKGKNMKVADIASELNVAHILEGSVRSSGNKVRITAQLIEARSDTNLWSETFDRDLDDIFAVQDEIAATVAGELRITLLGGMQTSQETDPDAYALYLQARHLIGRGSPESNEQATVLLRRALEIDPNYAAAWTILAAVYTDSLALDVLSIREARDLVLDATNRALAIDPDDAMSHAQRGVVALLFDNDPAAAAPHVQHALELDPRNLGILSVASTLLSSLHRPDEVIALEEFIVSRDPVNPRSHNSLGIARLWGRRWDDAITASRDALRLSPDLVGTHYYIGLALLRKGDPAQALQEFEREPDDEYRTKGRALALYSLGREDEFESTLAELISGWGEQWPSEVAHVYAWSGDTDTAFQWIEKAVAINEGGLHEQYRHPMLESLQTDPRWATFLEAVGSSPEQLASINFEVSVPR